jgi:hypothetical protein
VRKLALETSRAAIVIVKRTGITVPLVVPVTRIRNRLELGLRVVDRRTTLFRIDDTEVILVALTHENYYLVECLLCFGRFWILPENGREVCVSCANHQSQLLWSPSRHWEVAWVNAPIPAAASWRPPLRACPRRKRAFVNCGSRPRARLAHCSAKSYLRGISHVIRQHRHDVSKTHALSFSHAAAIFEKYKAVGPLTWIATSNSAIASQYFPSRKYAFP